MLYNKSLPARLVSLWCSVFLFLAFHSAGQSVPEKVMSLINCHTCWEAGCLIVDRLGTKSALLEICYLAVSYPNSLSLQAM